MLTKAEYVKRPEDINLGPIWNSMRARQRELSWSMYWMNCQMAQSHSNVYLGTGQSSGALWGALLGDAGSGPTPYDPQTP